MYYSVDRIEGTKAVLEDDNKKRTVVDMSLLPKDTEECDVLKKDENGMFIKDNEEKTRRQEIVKLMLESL